MTKSKEDNMAGKKKLESQVIDEALETALTEAPGAQDSLKPNSAPVAADPKSKVETMASIVGMAQAMDKEDLNSFWKTCLDQYAKLRAEGPGDAGSNQATQNMKPSDAQGSGGPKEKQSQPKLPASVQAKTLSVKEDLDTLFAEGGLTEDVQSKYATLFEAALSLRTSLIEAEIEEAYEARLNEEIEAFVTETKETLDAYVEYAVDNWIAENEVAIVDTLRLENTEEFMSKLKGLFVESYIDVPEERLDIVKEMAERVSDLESSLDETVKELADARSKLAESVKSETIDTVAEGLTLADRERFSTLIENVEFDGDAGSFEKKLKVVKETYFKKSVKGQVGVDTLNENTEGFTEKRQIYTDPLVAAAARMLGKDG